MSNYETIKETLKGMKTCDCTAGQSYCDLCTKSRETLNTHIDLILDSLEKPYNQRDHEHCMDTENPPCGLKVHTQCCLCRKPVEKPSQEEKGNGFMITWKPCDDCGGRVYPAPTGHTCYKSTHKPTPPVELEELPVVYLEQLEGGLFTIIRKINELVRHAKSKEKNG